MGTVLTLLMVIARKPIIHAFINDQEVVTSGIKMMIALQLSGPVIGILFLCINTLQGMGKALQSLLLTVCRQAVSYTHLDVYKRQGIRNGCACARTIGNTSLIYKHSLICTSTRPLVVIYQFCIFLWCQIIGFHIVNIFSVIWRISFDLRYCQIVKSCVGITAADRNTS